MFTDVVNITDEALVIKFYSPRWDKGEGVLDEEGNRDNNDVGSKQSGGAEKGEKLTCSRTARTFYDYCRKVKAARVNFHGIVGYEATGRGYPKG